LLLDHLDASQQPGETVWHGWKIHRVLGGANNILFRVTREEEDYAIKFTIRDSRNRAEREYNSLTALADAGLDVAPKPLLVDRDRYSQPVVVQSWLEGEVTSAVPANDTQWRRLLEHYATIHTLTLDEIEIGLAKAVINADSVPACKMLIQRQLDHIPVAALPADLPLLLQWLERLEGPEWTPVEQTLCRVDANTSNFVRRPGQ